MKTSSWLLTAALAATALLAGCSSPTVVTLQDGTEYITRSPPNTKTADGFYEFEDVSGKKVRVRADEVSTVKAGD